jgi:hypothetical protein
VKRLLPLVVLALAALALAPAASAKWCVRITASPARPVVGQPFTVRVQTFEPVLRGGRVALGKPIAMQWPAVLLLLVRPDGWMVNPTLRVHPDDPSIWQTRVTLRRAGPWLLRTADETPVPAGCRGRVALRVARR